MRDLEDGPDTSNADVSSTSCSTPRAMPCDHDPDFEMIPIDTPEAMNAPSHVSNADSDPVADEKTWLPYYQVWRGWILNRLSMLLRRPTDQTVDLHAILNSDTDDASKFEACCYVACMYGGRAESSLLYQTLQHANQIFERMLVNRDDKTLLSVLLALTILHAYDKGSVAESIIGSASDVADRLFNGKNSLTQTLEWLTAAAGSKIAECSIKTAELRAAYKIHHNQFGPSHQHTIVSLYCLAFSLIRDKEFEEAEIKFNELSMLGERHLLTVAALNGLGRAQTRQEKHCLAVDTLLRSLAYDTHEVNHPYRLESMRRLALVYKKIDQEEYAEELYWLVLEGRIRTLGKTHDDTEKARVQLEKLLKSMDKWDDEGAMAQRIQNLFDDEGNSAAGDFESRVVRILSRLKDV